jgi:hypothetical protein
MLTLLALAAHLYVPWLQEGEKLLSGCHAAAEGDAGWRALIKQEQAVLEDTRCVGRGRGQAHEDRAHMQQSHAQLLSTGLCQLAGVLCLVQLLAELLCC